jgi:hypothetical protein
MQKLRQLWNSWLKVARFLGDWIGRVILTIFYFTILLPFGVGVRLFSDPLATRPSHRAEWLARSTTDLTIDDARRQG